MPNLGPTELLIVGLILLLIFVAVAGGLVLSARRAARPPGPPAPAPTHLPLGLQNQAEVLIGRGKRIHAIKLVREQTGLTLTAAKQYVDDLSAGRIPQETRQLPHHGGASSTFPHHGGANLAARVRDLKFAGRAEQAVFLVRGETGMTEPDAQRFVDSIQ